MTSPLRITIDGPVDQAGAFHVHAELHHHHTEAGAAPGTTGMNPAEAPAGVVGPVGGELFCSPAAVDTVLRGRLEGEATFPVGAIGGFARRWRGEAEELI